MVRGEVSPLRRLASSSVLYAITGFAQQATGFLLIPVYTRIIPPAEYGVLELLTAFLSIAMMCATLGLTSAINKVYHRDCRSPEEQRAVVTTAVVTSLPLLALIGGLVLVFAEPITASLTGDPAQQGLLRIAVVSSLCFAVFAMVLGGLRAQERTAAYCVVSAVQFLLALAFNLVLVVVLDLGVRGILLGNLSANVVALGLGLWLARTGNRFVFDRRLVVPLFAFGLAIVPSMLSSWIMDVSDRYLLRLFRDLSEVAQYGVGYKFGLAVQLLVTWPFQLAWPQIAFGMSREEGHERTYARVLTYLLLVLTLALLVVVGAARSILPFVIGAQYAAGCGVIPIIAAAYALNALQFCVSPGIHVAGRTAALSGIGIVAAIVNVVLGLVLIPPLGMVGAAWATVAAYALAFAGAIGLAQRSHPVPYEYGRVARVLLAGIVGCALMRLVSTQATGAWLAMGQLGALGVFATLVWVSGFVDKDEREYLTRMMQRYVPIERGRART